MQMLVLFLFIVSFFLISEAHRHVGVFESKSFVLQYTYIFEGVSICLIMQSSLRHIVWITSPGSSELYFPSKRGLTAYSRLRYFLCRRCNQYFATCNLQPWNWLTFNYLPRPPSPWLEMARWYPVEFFSHRPSPCRRLVGIRNEMREMQCIGTNLPVFVHVVIFGREDINQC